MADELLRQQYAQRILMTITYIKALYKDLEGLVNTYNINSLSFNANDNGVWSGGPGGNRIIDATTLAGSLLFHADIKSGSNTILDTTVLSDADIGTYLDKVAVTSSLGLSFMNDSDLQSFLQSVNNLNSSI